jgi:hypothetical protein
MRQICAEAEAYLKGRIQVALLNTASLAGFVEPIAEAVVDAACLVAERLDAPLIVVATDSGRTALALSNRRPTAMILALTRTEQIARLLALCWGVTPVVQPEAGFAEAELVFATEWARSRQLVSSGQHVVLQRGQIPHEDRSRGVFAREVSWMQCIKERDYAMHRLVLLRLGESDWNRENRFTGWTDVDLSMAGVAEAHRAGQALRERGFTFDIEQITGLAGCDLLTISPDLLEQMGKTQGEVTRRLSVETSKTSTEKKIQLDEKGFRWMHNQDQMAVEKLSDGIRKFYADACKRENYVLAKVK